jgi:hypothetical protein
VTGADPEGSIIGQIRTAVRRGEYDMTFHAMEELAEDDLDVYDMEAAVLNGRIIRIETDDERGSRYTIHGTTSNGRTLVGVVCRFARTDRVLIITVYEVTEMES